LNGKEGIFWSFLVVGLGREPNRFGKYNFPPLSSIALVIPVFSELLSPPLSMTYCANMKVGGKRVEKPRK
jgi:hypothetical protein